METTARAIAKAVTWQLLGVVAMTLIGYLFTGSLSAGGSIAVAGTATGFVAYVLHERIWSGIDWGRAPRRASGERDA